MERSPSGSHASQPGAPGRPEAPDAPAEHAPILSGSGRLPRLGYALVRPFSVAIPVLVGFVMIFSMFAGLPLVSAGPAGGAQVGVAHVGASVPAAQPTAGTPGAQLIGQHPGSIRSDGTAQYGRLILPLTPAREAADNATRSVVAGRTNPLALSMVPPGSSSNSSHPALAPPPLGPNVATVTGTVQNALWPHQALSGVLVTAVSLGGNCQQGLCPSVQTDVRGQFSVKAWYGTDQITLSLSYYLDNYTVISNVTSGSQIALGTIYMVPDATVGGTLEANDSAHTPLSGVQITGQSRDGRIVATPSPAYSSPTGTFNVSVPPGQSEVQFQQKGIFQGNTIYVSLKPGQHLNVGVILETVGVVITVSPYSQLTHQKLPGSGTLFWAIKACARNEPGDCFQQGPTVPQGSPTSAVAPAGADTITVYADAYIANTTQMYVPEAAPGTMVNLGRVYLLPNMPVTLTASLTWPSTVARAEAMWPTGLLYVTTCSLNDYQFSSDILNQFGGMNMTESTCNTGGCAPVGSPMTVAAAPLRDFMTVRPDTSAVCGFTPTWPIPNYLPIYDNWTWVNVTEGYGLNIGHVDVTPGTYVQGTILLAGVPARDHVGLPFTMGDCSTDVNVCMYGPGGSVTNTSVNKCGPGAYINQTFCVPVMPGPSRLSVNVPGCITNTTIIYDPPGQWGSAALTLAQATENHISAINITCDYITGTVRDSVSGVVPQGLVTVTVKPAGFATYPQQSCVANDTTGAFRCPAAPGWDDVYAAAPNYATNYSYLHVTNGSNPAGTINLTQLALLTGRVVGPNGYPINTSTAQFCPIFDANAGSCTNVLGSGMPNTNGTWWSFAYAGHVPIGQYYVDAFAPGYLSNSTWLNATAPGAIDTADTIVLQPLLGAQSPGAAGGAGPTVLGAWVAGYVVDNVTGQGLPATTIQITPVGGGAPSAVSGGITPEGYFNFSLPLGEYWMNFTDPSYYYTNATFQVVNGTQPYMWLGTVRLTPFHYLAGRVVVDPWRNAVTVGEGVGPQSSVQVCVFNRTICGAAGPTDSGGFFNVTAPIGKYDRVAASGLGTGTGTATGGFLNNVTFWNVTQNNTNSGPNFTVGQIIFAAYGGLLRDASTQNATPVRWAPVALQTTAPTFGTSTAASPANGGGLYIAFLAGGNLTSDIASALSYESNNTTIRYDYSVPEMQNVTADQFNVASNISMVHFGWVEFLVQSNPVPFQESSGLVPFASVSANVTDQFGHSFSSVGTGDEGGLVNVTAPPGRNVTLSVRGWSGGDSNLTVVYHVWVNESETTFYNGTGPQALGNVTIQPWAWFSGVVYDPAVHEGVPLASVTDQNYATQAGNPQTTNQIGQFLADIPNGPDFVAVQRGGYTTNNSYTRAQPGSEVVLPTVNITGEGIVAGRVFGYPGNAPLYGAIVHICPVTKTTCTDSNSSTNGSGYFWVTAEAGLDVINITLPGYSSNSTGEILVRSDTWNWSGTYVLSQYATVTGMVLANPSGFPVYYANVSACSALVFPGEPTGPCFATVKTDTYGQFALSIPSGNYLLAINQSDYNATYLPISLSPGEQVSVGTIFLEQYGALVGTVYGADTDAAIPGTTVQACPLWLAGNCTPEVAAGSNGRFALYGPPGTYSLEASAPGYQTAYVDAIANAGVTSPVAPIYLQPSGTGTLYTLRGLVVGGTNLQPLDGAIVSAGTDYATATNSTGAFSLVVPWGTYYVSAVANGYQAVGQTLSVHENYTGLNYVLPLAVFSLTGTTKDGLTGAPLADVSIYEDNQLVTQSDRSGAYSLTLPNGTFTFRAQATGSFASLYAPVTFTVAVTGAGGVRDVQLFPPQSQIYGLVVDSLTGQPIANVSVSIVGTTVDGVPWSGIFRSSGVGTFVVPIYDGSYRLNASAPGFLGAQTTVQPSSAAAVPVTLSLTPISTAPANGGGTTPLTPYLVLGALVVVSIAGFLALGRLRAAGTDDEAPPAGRRAGGEGTPP
jgi:hypothetical protein